MSPKPLTIFLLSMDSAGHIYPVIGLGQALASRGHTVKLLINEVFAEQFAKYGFEMIILRRANVELENGKAKNPIKGMAEHLLASGYISNMSPVEKLKKIVNPMDFLQRLFDANVDYQPQLEAAFKAHQPDLVVVDHFLLPSALNQSGVPYVNISSGNPMSLYGSEKLPPAGAGFPTDSDPATWIEFKELTIVKMKIPGEKYQKDLDALFGYDPEADPNAKSKRVELYMYPEELDYHDIAPLPSHCIRVDALCFHNPEPFELPEGFVQPGDRLIYVSLGSMCSVDVALMKKILAALAKTSHKCIVSKGPKADEFDLPANCWGQAFLPQTRILPLVDLVITHGGNNTLTETFTFGKPLIVMGFFGDQYDNAQRVAEKGFGVRLEPYNFTEKQLIDAVESLLSDKATIARAKAAAERIAKANSKELACQKIEEFVEQFNSRKL